MDGFGDGGGPREGEPRLPERGFQGRHKGRTLLSAYSQTLFGALAVDAAFDIEQGVDALDRFESDWRDRRRLLAAPGIGRDIRQLEELPPGMCPAQCGRNRSLRARRIVELVVPAIGVGLQDAGESLKMLHGMLVLSIARGVIERRRRCGAPKRPGVTEMP